MYRLMLQGALLSVVVVGLVRAECGGDTTACDTTTINRYPLEGADDAGEITYDPSGCVATTASTMISCSGTLLGFNSLECSVGDWTIANPTVSCFAASGCPVPDTPTNGNTTGDDYSLFETIQYVCNDGYKRVGADSAFCDSTGEWSLPAPRCLGSCTRPNLNATVSITPEQDTYEDGTIAQFTCDDATTTMTGTDASTCRDGAWSPTPPACYRKCTIGNTNSSTLGNGLTVGQLVDHQTSIEFQCDAGRHYNEITLGSTSGVQVCNDGELPSPFAYCHANCTASSYTPPEFAVAEPALPTYYDKTDIQFTCESGVLSVPDVTGTCADGMWGVPSFECIQPLDCTDPGSPANGMAVGNDYNHDAEVSFTCNTNFTLVGVSMMRCNNGSWSSNVPTCNETPRPVTNSSVRLECRSDSIRVTIDRSILPDLAGDVIRFEDDPTCTGVVEGDNIVFTTMFEQCGTTKEEDGDLDVYKNRIVNGRNSGNVVSRDITVSFPITCFYERVHRLEYGYSAVGSAGVVQQSVSSTGDYSATFGFEMYTDDTFTTKVDSSATDVSVNQRAYFAVEATTSADQRVVIDSCWTTPTTEPEDSRRYNLITDGCQVEQTVMRYDLGMNGLAAFSLSGFTYIDTSQIYLHCTVAICGNNDTSGECAPCASMARRRRGATSGQMRDLSVGPVRWIKEDSNKVMDLEMAVEDAEILGVDSAGQGARPWMTAVAVMATVMAAMVVVIVVLVRKNRRQSSRFN
ncbi:uncharacterized protein LOC752518 [Strongylocentrotus purpuratus]|uniref:Uncharacterized protein n=1 Tax=Strongylocentrotus purpuratus TaxID=7668 RepID=A0A7M7LWH4_STRPU|nr:uncharacterized protein LOC752518 [Strongylocentrotus purpuratus]